jgi:hypothetical protein
MDFFFVVVVVVLCRGTLSFTEFLQYINCVILEFTASTTLLYPPPLIHGVVTTDIIIAFTCIYKQRKVTA